MPAKTKNKINLLPQEEFERSSLGRVLAWLLSSFRVFVVATELIVILAFLSRFWLDAKNNDLDDNIKQREALITASLPFEKDFKATQRRLKIYSELSKDKNTSDIITLVSSYLPLDVKLVNINVTGNNVLLTGESASELSILQFLTNLAGSKKFADSTLVGAGSSTENVNSLNFNLKVKIN